MNDHFSMETYGDDWGSSPPAWAPPRPAGWSCCAASQHPPRQRQGPRQPRSERIPPLRLAKEAKEAKCCSRCTCHIAMDNFSSVQRIKIIEFLWLRLVLRLSHWIVLKREMQREMQNVKCNACRRYEFRQAWRKAGLTFRDAEEAGGQPGLVHLMVKHDESQNFKSRWGNGISMNFRSKI
jgi:hypothetical protein